MIKKQTWLNIADGSNVQLIKVFHLYKGFWRKTSYPGLIIKGSVKKINPPRTEYKGFKFKANKKGDVCRSLIIRTRYNFSFKNNLPLRFYTNSSILIKKRLNPKSKYHYGPSIRILNKKRFLNLFKVII